MSAIIDIVALTLIIAVSIIGLLKGFARTFISIFGTFISLLLSVLLCTTVANFLENSFNFVTTVSKWLNGVLTKIFGDNLMNTTLNQATEQKMSELNLTAWLIRIVLSVKEGGNVPLDTTLNQIICPVFAFYIVVILSVLVLFFIFKIICFLIKDILIKVRKIKIVKAVDNTLGFILGIIYGVILINLIILIINIMPLGFFQKLSSEIENTVITNFLSKINIFSLIINGLTNPQSIINIIINKKPV